MFAFSVLPYSQPPNTLSTDDRGNHPVSVSGRDARVRGYTWFLGQLVCRHRERTGRDGARWFFEFRAKPRVRGGNREIENPKIIIYIRSDLYVVPNNNVYAPTAVVEHNDVDVKRAHIFWPNDNSDVSQRAMFPQHMLPRVIIAGKTVSLAFHFARIFYL